MFMTEVSPLSGKRICITGGSGFLGSFVQESLHRRGIHDFFIPASKNYNLINAADIKRMLEDSRPDVIIHLAANVGGIGANREHPAEFFYDNLMMGVQLIHVQSQAYRQQYGFNSIYLLPVNLYGPRDNFSPRSSHVIPALIHKCYEAKLKGDPEVIIWGDGTPTREFIYAGDAAEGIVMAAEFYNGPDPVNIGSGNEISIRDLAEKIAVLTGFKGKIVFDPTKPNGQPRRALDVTRAKEYFGFSAKMDFDTGLKNTIEYYISNRDAILKKG
jgi:GDP-L-fucose synthase